MCRQGPARVHGHSQQVLLLSVRRLVDKIRAGELDRPAGTLDEAWWAILTTTFGELEKEAAKEAESSSIQPLSTQHFSPPETKLLVCRPVNRRIDLQIIHAGTDPDRHTRSLGILTAVGALRDLEAGRIGVFLEQDYEERFLHGPVGSKYGLFRCNCHIVLPTGFDPGTVRAMLDRVTVESVTQAL